MRRWMAAVLLLIFPCLALGETAAQLPQRVVYLTFDDGPRANTPELLAILEELGVPATFFLTGAGVEAFPEHAKMILEAGYPIGCHTMKHSYRRLKESTAYVERDYERFIETMRTYVDPDFTTDLYRFPGGSTSYSGKTKRFVRDMGLAWFDWNGQNSDAERKFNSDREMINVALKSVGKQDVVIMLMHEGVGRTRRTLPEIVRTLLERGYEFRTLSTSAEDREILARCSANMMLPEAGTEGGN